MSLARLNTNKAQKQGFNHHVFSVYTLTPYFYRISNGKQTGFSLESCFFFDRQCALKGDLLFITGECE